MPEFIFNFIQISFVCCGRRNRRNNGPVSEPETASDIDTFSDFELIQSATPRQYPTLSRARLRWVRAILAAILRQRIVRAYNQLSKITKRNKAIGVPNPAVSRLWGQTGNWLQRHKL